MRSWGMLVIGLAAAAGAGSRLAAQCTSPTPQVQDACNTAVDAYKTFQPLAGVAVSGGNPGLGSARTLGGLGHLFVTARVNAVKAMVPNPDTSSAASVEGAIPAPLIEGGIGVFRGLKGGLLAVDVLASAVLLPTGLDKLSVDPDAAKVGLRQRHAADAAARPIRPARRRGGDG